MRNLRLLLVLLLAWGYIYANDLILEIKITGNENIEQELIKSLLNFEVGDNLSADNISETYKSLYQLGVFKNIELNQSDLPAGTSVDITVEEYPIVQEISFRGNNKLSRQKLTDLSAVKVGSYWAPFVQKEVELRIKAEYAKKGYHLVEIDFDAQTASNNKVELSVKIDEGRKVVIKSIKIHGNKEIKAKKLLGQMKTKPQGFLRSGKLDQEKLDTDLTQIVDYYNKKGFIDSRVINYDKQISEGYYYLDVYIYEGAQYKFGTVTVEGNTRFSNEIIINQFKFEKGDPFNKEKYEIQKNDIRSLYFEDGYIYSVINEENTKDGDLLNINLVIVENTRAKIRKIEMVGNRRTKEKVIRRKLAISPGDYFQQSRVKQTLYNIYNMGFFEPDLYPDSKQINRNGDVDLVLHMSDKSSGTANGGIAINSADGLVGQLSVSHNNLFGNSWQTSVKTEFGGSTQNYSFSFTNPYFKDSNTLLGFDAYHTTQEYDVYGVNTNGGTIRVGRPLGFLNFGKVVFGYSLYAKKYEILDGEEENSWSSLDTLDTKGWQNTSSVSLNLTRDSRDNNLFATTGSQLTLYSEFAGGPLQGDFDYFKQIAQVSWYTKTYWKLVLATKWRFGYVNGFNGKDVPPDERFYLGGTGADGLRGYGDNEVGPDDGGLREIIFSTEYSAPIAGDQIVGLLFFDAGNSYNSLEEFNFWELKKGAGLGIRIQSPFGLIGFDYARNFEDREWVPHFQFGTTF